MGGGTKAALWVAGTLALALVLCSIFLQLDGISEKVDDLADRFPHPKQKPEDMPPIEVMPESIDSPVTESESTASIVPIKSPSERAKPATTSDLTHSEDFRMVKAHGKTFSLTLYQSRAFEKLWKACQNRLPELHQAAILEGIESCSKRLRDVFKSNMEAYRALIAPGKRKGTFRLNLR